MRPYYDSGGITIYLLCGTLSGNALRAIWCASNLEQHEDLRWNTGGWGHPPSMGPGLTGMRYGAVGVWGEITAPAHLGGRRDTYFWTWAALDAGKPGKRVAFLGEKP